MRRPHGEELHTGPKPFCRHPERWTAYDGQSAEIEVSEFISAIIRVVQPDVCFEAGTCFGRTAAVIGEALRSNGHGHLYTVEPLPDRVEIARERCLGLPVTIIEGYSEDWTPEGIVDFVFFDGLFEGRVSEYRRLRPYFDESSVLVFHDTAPHKDQYLREIEGELNAIRLHTPRGLTVCQIAQPITSRYRRAQSAIEPYEEDE